MRTQFEVKLFGKKKKFTVGDGHVTRAVKKTASNVKRKVRSAPKKAGRRIKKWM